MEYELVDKNVYSNITANRIINMIGHEIDKCEICSIDCNRKLKNIDNITDFIITWIIWYMQEIYEAYYNLKTGFQWAEKLYTKLKDKGIKRNQIKDFINTEEVHQLHKQQHKITKFSPITAGHENENIQLDLADLSDISTSNSNYKWLLCGVDVFTRKDYIVPMKNKTASNVTATIKKTLNKSKPENINCDQCSEFMPK